MQELWGMRSTPSSPLLPCPIWTEVVVPDRVLSMDQIELNCVLMLNWIFWNRIIMTFLCQTELLEIELFLRSKLFSRQTELFEIELYICITMELSFNNLQWLICHKTKSNHLVSQLGQCLTSDAGKLLFVTSIYISVFVPILIDLFSFFLLLLKG